MKNIFILEQLKVRQHDPEETVRMEVVSAVLNAAKKDFKMITDELLAFIKERTLDKKVILYTIFLKHNYAKVFTTFLSSLL